MQLFDAILLKVSPTHAWHQSILPKLPAPEGSPVVNVLEAVFVGDVVRKGYAVRSAVVSPGNHVEFLLTGRVPYLTPNSLAMDIQGLHLRFPLQKMTW